MHVYIFSDFFLRLLGTSICSTSPTSSNQVDSLLLDINNTGSGHELDLARGSVTCLGDFDLKMYIMEKLFGITRGLKTILPRGLNVKGLENGS